MYFLKKIRTAIGHYLLKLKLKKVNRSVKICNLNTAKYIGIVFDSESGEDYEMAKKVESEYIKNNIKVELIGFTNKNQNTETLIGDKNHHFINTKDFNWLYQPKSETIKNIMDKKFDILINLYPENIINIEFIVKLSPSPFKVGSAHLNDDIHDLMIDVGDKKDDLSYLCNQITHYLSMINK